LSDTVYKHQAKIVNKS